MIQKKACLKFKQAFYDVIRYLLSEYFNNVFWHNT